jgi:hypothetical protein
MPITQEVCPDAADLYPIFFHDQQTGAISRFCSIFRPVSRPAVNAAHAHDFKNIRNWDRL